MNTKHIHTKIILSILIISILGCKKEFLDTQPLSFFSPGNSLLDRDGMEAALGACGKVLRAEYYDMGQWSEYIFSDVCIYGGDDPNSLTDLTTMILPDASWGLTTIMPYWESWWNLIKYANIVIDRIDDATFNSEEDKDAILGGNLESILY